MICGTLLRRAIDPYRAARGEMYGATVAENELIRATLDTRPEISWDFWAQGISPSVAKTFEEKERYGDLTALKTFYEDRTRVYKIEALPAVAANKPYLFVTNVPSFSQLSEIRERFGCDTIPICSLVHSVLTPNLLATYSWLAVNAQSSDVLVASSKAGHTALDNIFMTVSERFARKSPKGRSPFEAPRIVDIPFGVNIPAEALLDRQIARRTLNLPSDAFVILYLGRVSEQYKADLDPLVQAMASLSQENDNIWLIIAGQAQEETYNAHLLRRLHRLNLDKRTLRLENFPGILKSTIYAACDVFVSPSDSIQETFGLALLESMAHARPVITSSWSGYRDLVQDGVNGFLIGSTIVPEVLRKASRLDPLIAPRQIAHSVAQGTVINVSQLTDRLRFMLANPASTDDMGRAARRWAMDRYAWPVVAKQFYDLWTEQIELAKVSNAPVRQKAGLERYFEHYADRFLESDDVLSTTLAQQGNEHILKHWKFNDPRVAESLEQLLGVLGSRSITVNEAYQDGYEPELVAWLLKKGLIDLTVK
jgi:glycosyltransferase involved in cell wall biosynthesis